MKSKSAYPVTISSTPSGAHFTVKSASGSLLAAGTTPKTITLNSATGYFQPANYVVEFTYGGTTQSVRLNARIDKWYWDNVFMGSPGIVIGMLIVDPSTGKMWKLNTKVNSSFGKPASTGPQS